MKLYEIFRQGSSFLLRPSTPVQRSPYPGDTGSRGQPVPCSGEAYRKRMVRGKLAMNPDGEGIDLLVDELKRFQMMPTDSGNWRYSGKRNGGDDRVFALLLAVAGAELAQAREASFVSASGTY